MGKYKFKNGKIHVMNMIGSRDKLSVYGDSLTEKYIELIYNEMQKIFENNSELSKLGIRVIGLSETFARSGDFKKKDSAQNKLAKVDIYISREDAGVAVISGDFARDNGKYEDFKREFNNLETLGGIKIKGYRETMKWSLIKKDIQINSNEIKEPEERELEEIKEKKPEEKEEEKDIEDEKDVISRLNSVDIDKIILPGKQIGLSSFIKNLDNQLHFGKIISAKKVNDKLCEMGILKKNNNKTETNEVSKDYGIEPLDVFDNETGEFKYTQVVYDIKAQRFILENLKNFI